jgi:hypothetical protein
MMDAMAPGTLTCWAQQDAHRTGEAATLFIGSRFYEAEVLEVADDGRFPDLERVVFALIEELPS